MRIACPRMDELQQQVLPDLEALARAAALPEALHGAVLSGGTSVVARLARLVYTLPATLGHHGASSAGLLRHSLAVAHRAVVLHRQRCPPPAGDGLDAWRRAQVGVLMGGLAHELGRVGAWNVQAGSTTWTWDEDLSAFAAAARTPVLTVRLRATPPLQGPGGHGAFGLWLLPRVLPAALLAWLGAPVLQALVAAGMTPGGGGGSDLPLLIAAAGAAVRAAVPATSRPASSAVASLGAGGLAEDWCAGLRHLVASGRARVNTIDAHLLTSATHTLVFLGTPGGESLPALVRAHLQAVTAGQGMASAHWAGSSVDGLLAALGTATSEDGRPWCIPSPEVGATATGSIVHRACLATPDGQREREGLCVVLRHGVLWSASERAALGVYPDGVSLHTEDGQRPSIDAQDCGFESLPVPPPLPLLPIAAAPLAPVGEPWSLDGLTGTLLEEVDRLCPTIGAGGMRHAGRSSSAERPRPLTPLRALEACCARLHALPTPDPPPVPAEPAAVGPDAMELEDDVPPIPRDTQDLVACIGGALAALQAAALDPPPVPPGADEFHVLVTGDGALHLPWPQCLDGVLPPTAQLRLRAPQAAEAIAIALGLTAPTRRRIEGFPYRACPWHRLLTVPAGWRPRHAPLRLPFVPVIVPGALEAPAPPPVRT